MKPRHQMMSALLLATPLLVWRTAVALAQPVAEDALRAFDVNALIREPLANQVLTGFSLVVVTVAVVAPLLLLAACLVHGGQLWLVSRRVEALDAYSARIDASVVRRNLQQAFGRSGSLPEAGALYAAQLVIERDPVRETSRLVSFRRAADYLPAAVQVMDPAVGAIFARLPAAVIVLGVLGCTGYLTNGLLHVAAGDATAILIERARDGVLLLFACLFLAMVAVVLRWIARSLGRSLARRLSGAIDALFWRPVRSTLGDQPGSDNRVTNWLNDALALIDRRLESDARVRGELMAELRHVVEAMQAAGRDHIEDGRRLQESLQRIAQQFGDGMQEVSRDIAALAAAPAQGAIRAALDDMGPGIAEARSEIGELKRQLSGIAADAVDPLPLYRELRGAVDGTNEGLAALRTELVEMRRQVREIANPDPALEHLQTMLDTVNQAVIGVGHELGALKPAGIQSASAHDDPILGDLCAAVDGMHHRLASLQEEIGELRRHASGGATTVLGTADPHQIADLVARLATTSEGMRESIGRLSSIVDSLSRLAASLAQRPERPETAARPTPDQGGAQALLSELRELMSQTEVANIGTSPVQHENRSRS